MKIYFALSVLIIAALSSGQAAVINVPADQPTIQAGIDAAQISDTVLVAPGIYSGDGFRDINFNGKSISVIADEGFPIPLISCEGSVEDPHVGFILENGEDSTTLLQGFRISGAYSEYYGAIKIDSASPTIRNCRIGSNSCSGIWAFDAVVHIDGCRINGNAGHGYQSTSGQNVITRCSIYENDSNGVSIEWSGTLDISDCSIYDNAGDGIYTTTMYQSFIVRGCNIIGNQNGIIWWANFPKVSDSTALKNRQEIFEVANNIIAFNDSLGIYGEYDYNEQTDSFTQCNDVFGNPHGDFIYLTNYGGDPYGNISEDPQFCLGDPWGSILFLSSPCAPENNSCGELIGRYEAICTGICGDTNYDYLVNLLDIITIIRYQYGLDEGPFYPTFYWDVNGNGVISILDITYFIAYLYLGGPELNCIPW